MITKKIISLLFDSIFFFLTAAISIFLFFFVSEGLAKDTSSPAIYGGISAITALVSMYLVYSFISKILEK
ncbi:hypothetical protein [Candidatus Thiosymbion oneisti]|uniref:hypothetical protein n=1 Tax=Candidatus Thiosymbion oneisti TaxID=589554 RepID=UPI001A9C7C0F|nr:hypothetical protein [Candidatus Thiosymbion oneisti]